MIWRKSNAILVASLTVGLAGCGVESPQAPADGTAQPLPSSLGPANVQINNDPALLEERIERAAQPLTIFGREGAGAEQGVLESSKSSVKLTLVGTVRPPVVEGRVVQANDVDINGQTAIVAYNFAGDPFAGAVQVIDFTHPERPTIVSEMLYRAADVNAVSLLGSHLYVGMASDDGSLSTPALVEELKYTPGKGLEQTGRWLDLPSWAVTDLAAQGDDVLATVGAQNGGVVLMRRTGTSMTLASFASSADARGVAWDSQASMSVRGGQGMLLRHGVPGLTAAGQTAVDGYKNSAAKGTIEVYEHRCYLGAGDGGFQVRDSDGSLLASLRPTLTTNMDPSTSVVNAATVADDLGFLAAGSQGVLVVALGHWRCDGHSSEDSGSLELLGQLGLEAGASCNMVKTKNDILVVAGGAGGVKLVSMSDK